MDSFITFAEVAGAIIAAMGLAMWLEWMTLNGLMHLMSGRGSAAPQASNVSPESIRPGSAGVRMVPSNSPVLTLFPH